MKHVNNLLAACLILIALPIAAAPTFVEGQDYSAIPSAIRKNPDVASLLADNPKKVQLVFFFSYGCPACYKFDPFFEQWVSSQKHSNLAIYRIPVSFEADWNMLARMYYIMQDLKPKQDLSKQIFDAVNKDSVQLWRKSVMKDFFVQHGYSAQSFETAYDSFAVNNQLKTADNLSVAFDVNATPTLIINGRYDSYTVTTTMDHQRMFQVLDYLISKEEKQL